MHMNPGIDPLHCMNWVCWHTPVILVLKVEARRSGVKGQPELYRVFETSWDMRDPLLEKVRRSKFGLMRPPLSPSSNELEIFDVIMRVNRTTKGVLEHAQGRHAYVSPNRALQSERPAFLW